MTTPIRGVTLSAEGVTNDAGTFHYVVRMSSSTGQPPDPQNPSTPEITDSEDDEAGIGPAGPFRPPAVAPVPLWQTVDVTFDTVSAEMRQNQRELERMRYGPGPAPAPAPATGPSLPYAVNDERRVIPE